MSAKAEIGWRRVDDQGERCQLYAHRVGGEWRFFMRHRRYEPWRPVPNPELVDWLELLRGIVHADDLPALDMAPMTALRRSFEGHPGSGWDA